MRITYGRKVIVKTGSYQNQHIYFELQSDEFDGSSLTTQVKESIKDNLIAEVDKEIARRILATKGQEIKRSNVRKLQHAKATLEPFGLQEYADDFADEIPF